MNKMNEKRDLPRGTKIDLQQDSIQSGGGGLDGGSVDLDYMDSLYQSKMSSGTKEETTTAQNTAAKTQQTQQTEHAQQQLLHASHKRTKETALEMIKPVKRIF